MRLRASLIVVSLCVASWASGAKAETEIVELGAALVVGTCEFNGDTAHCTVPSLPGRGTPVELNLTANEEGYQHWEGKWSDVWSENGFSFMAEVHVNKIVYQGESSFFLQGKLKDLARSGVVERQMSVSTRSLDSVNFISLPGEEARTERFSYQPALHLYSPQQN